MRRADRLFEIIQILRRIKLVRAQDLAQKLEVSERTIYRDIADLMSSGVPIDGEAGVGYILRHYDLPPIMFNEHEIEALVLGARIIETWSDPELAAAAGNAIAKIETVIPDRLRRHMAETVLLAPADHFAEPVIIDPAELRHAVRHRHRIHFCYRDAQDSHSERGAWPLAVAFFGPVWILAAWCEWREGFRSFRLDRMSDLVILDDKFQPEPDRTIEEFLNSGWVKPR